VKRTKAGCSAKTREKKKKKMEREATTYWSKGCTMMMTTIMTMMTMRSVVDSGIDAYSQGSNSSTSEISYTSSIQTYRI
jgi:hypothetical protein